MPFGRAWIRSVRVEDDARTTTGYLITGKAGRDLPAVVAIPGALRAAETLLEAARHLSKDFDVLIVNCPGLGGTTVAEAPSVAGYAARAAGLVDAFLGGRRIVMLGESIGAIVAADLAQRQPAAVASVVMIDPPVSADSLEFARAYLLGPTAGLDMDSYFKQYASSDGVFRSVDGTGYWGLLKATADRVPVLLMTGGRLGPGPKGDPGALFSPADEAVADRTLPSSYTCLRLPTSGHIAFEDGDVELAGSAIASFLIAEAVRVGAVAHLCLVEPENAEARAALLAALRQIGTAIRRDVRASLLRLLGSRFDDPELADEILRVLGPCFDDPTADVLATVAERERRADAGLRARLHLAKNLSGLGDADHALALLREFDHPNGVPARISSLMLNLAIYRTDANDATIAAEKAAHLRRVRSMQGASINIATRRTPGPPRVGFVGGALSSRNYMSLMIPMLRELAKLPVAPSLISVTAASLDGIRPEVPESVPMRALGLMTADTYDDPDMWSRTADALAAFEFDLLVDLDDSLMVYSPAYIARRPARFQASWFNMSGPSHDACFDAAIGPAAIYPEELDAEFRGRLARLPSDHYVFEPEMWKRHGLAFPEAGPLPALRNGYVTFGSLSNLYKVSDACLALWAKVLLAVPGSRLYLGNGSVPAPEAARRVLACLERRGVEPTRVTFAHHFDWPRYLAGYENIDVVLGTYPVSGGTTLFEAVHLGMPVICRNGPTSLGRIGRWIEAATGRAGIAHDDDGSFVREAARLARSLDELAQLRRRAPEELSRKSSRDAGPMARAFLDVVTTRFMPAR